MWCLRVYMCSLHNLSIEDAYGIVWDRPSALIREVAHSICLYVAGTVGTVLIGEVFLFQR